MQNANNQIKTITGFTLFELLTVLGIIAILGAIAVPNLISWQTKAKLRGAVNNLTGDLQMAKSRAIKQHTTVTVQFTVNGYTITTTDGQVFRNREMPAGITIVPGPNPFLDNDADGNPDTSFNPRGIPRPGIAGDLGSVIVQGAIENREICINMTGCIEVI
jgi:type IV fimbrial biogenesis protein FimT